jgi:hypothetical protein
MMEQMWIGGRRVVNCRLDGIPNPRHPSNSSSGWLQLTSAQLFRKPRHLEKSFVEHKMCVSCFSTALLIAFFALTDIWRVTRELISKYTQKRLTLQLKCPLLFLDFIQNWN